MSESGALCLFADGAATGTVMATQMELPLRAWDEGLELRTQDGTCIKRFGKISEMSRVLFDLDREACYRLIEDGKVDGFKRGEAHNAHYRVDLLSVWRYRKNTYKR